MGTACKALPRQAVRLKDGHEVPRAPVRRDYRLQVVQQHRVQSPPTEDMNLPLLLLQHVFTWAWSGCTQKQNPSSQAQPIALPAALASDPARAPEKHPCRCERCPPNQHDSLLQIGLCDVLPADFPQIGMQKPFCSKASTMYSSLPLSRLTLLQQLVPAPKQLL